MAEVAADEAAFIAAVAAALAADESAGGVVTVTFGAGVVTVVVDGIGAGTGTVVVVVSFLVQAANDTAAASVAISRTVFMVLLG